MPPKPLLFIIGLILCLACSSSSKETPSPMPNPGVDQPTVQSWILGDTADVSRTALPGVVLMGGSTDVDEAMRWMIARSGGGDFVILRASGADGYNPYLFNELGGANSCETFLVNRRDKASNARLIRRVRGAEALFIAGGDQANYVNFWKGTPLAQAINFLINEKKVTVGGTSAGCAILGRHYFAALNGTVNSETALANPMTALLTLGKDDFINIAGLRNTITDSHYDNPDRRGRQLTFLARMVADQVTPARGIGVPERTAVLVDEKGIASVVGRSRVCFLQSDGQIPEILVANTPLTWDRGGKAVRVTELGANDGTINLANWQTSDPLPISFFFAKVGSLFVGQ